MSEVAAAGRADLGALFDDHVRHEFVELDVDAAMATMAAEPYVNNVPVMTGGVGREEVRRFYAEQFTGQWPADIALTPVSRTVGADRVVDEMVLGFTHDVPMDWLLPGVPPTGRRVEVPVVVVMAFAGGKVAHEHIYWDQASVLVQVGLLDPRGLPVTGAEQARKLLDPSMPPDAPRRAVSAHNSPRNPGDRSMQQSRTGRQPKEAAPSVPKAPSLAEHPHRTDDFARVLMNHSGDASSAFAAGPAVENSLFYMGSLMSVLAPTKRTDGAFSLLEYRSRPGHEPPPHIHVGQDELLYLLEGEIEAYTPDLTAARVGAGEALFLPRDQAHAWYVTSPTLRMLIMTNPAGLDDYFAAMAEPATGMELPAQGTTYAMDDPGRAIEIGRRYGLRFLTPEEIRELLPNYPGFGVSRERVPQAT